MASSPAFAVPARTTALVTPPRINWDGFLAGIAKGRAVVECKSGDAVFMQGESADSVFFLLRGKVRVIVASQEGKEAIVATLGPGEFFGEGCLGGQLLRMATVRSVGDSRLAEVKKPLMAQMLRDEPGLAELFIPHLLSRIIRYEADFVDQLFNSSEKRLARILLLLSHFGRDSQQEEMVPGITQEHLAQMVGTTRARINFFMNKFRKLGFVDYSGETGVSVRRGLLSVVRHDESEPRNHAQDDQAGLF